MVNYILQEIDTEETDDTGSLVFQEASLTIPTTISQKQFWSFYQQWLALRRNGGLSLAAQSDVLSATEAKGMETKSK